MSQETSTEAATVLLHRARREPAATVRRARELLADAAPRDAVRLRHAIALASVENGALSTAAAELAAAMSLARGCQAPDQLGELTLSAAWVELERGNLDAARALLDTIQPVLRGDELAKAGCLRGLLRYAAGEYAAASSELDEAIRLLRKAGDRHWLANALVARAAAATYLAQFPAADADFDRAATYFLALGEVDRAACCVHNRGFVALRRGDLAAALRYYEQAERAGLVLARHPELLVDRAETLLAAGLAADARAALEEAAGLLGSAQRGTKIADLLLSAADCALRAGDHVAAADVAERVLRMLSAQQRTALLPVARAVLLRARVAAGMPAPDAERVAAECDRRGWQVVAAQLRLAAGGSWESVARQRFAGPAAVRVLGWLAAARLAETAGADASVRSAAEAGLRVAARYAGVGEPGAAALATVRELAGLGLAAALRGGRARCVFRWIERYRSLAPGAAREQDGTELADALARLRQYEQGDERLAAAERAVRRAAVRGRAAASVAEPVRCQEVAAELGDRVLLSWTVHEETLYVVTIVDGRYRMRACAAWAEVDELVESLRFACTPTDAVFEGVTGGLAQDCAKRLDAMLLAPLAEVLGARPLVVVPGPLHGLPWSSLPSCHGRPVSVAPSGAAWLHAHRQRTRAAHGMVWAAGPRLRHAEQEVRALREEFGGTLLQQATVAELLITMDGTEYAHIAAHGEFRADAPMFSGLRLADGLLYAHDLERLDVAPKVLVLSACESARHSKQLLGLSTSLLRKGSVAVIASLLPVPDERAGPLLTAVHQQLASGCGPAEALARAQAAHGHLGFVCLGAG